MSRPLPLLSFGSSVPIDIGNTAANVSMLLVSSRCVLDLVVAVSDTAQTSNAILTFSVMHNGTYTANAAGVVTIPASASAGQAYMDTSARGLLLYAGDIIQVAVADAGDSGEKVCVAALAVSEPDADANEAAFVIES